MKYKRFLCLLTTLILAVSLWGCSAPAPEPEPTPSATIGGSTCDSPDCNVSKPVSIWFLTYEEEWITEERFIEWPPWGTSLEEFSTQQLFQGSKDGHAIVPEGCELLSFTSENGAVTIVADATFPFEDGAASVAAQSIKKTLFQYDYIKTILLTD